MSLAARLLRRSAGDRRSSRVWDRGQWLCCVLVALTLMGLGLWSGAAMVLGRPVESTVQSCRTDLHAWGRFLGHRTECSVTTGDDDTYEHVVEASRRVPAGGALPLVELDGTYADAALTRDQTWFLPLGLAAAAGTWWMGFPSRVDLSYGRHAAPRKPGRRSAWL